MVLWEIIDCLFSWPLSTFPITVMPKILQFSSSTAWYAFNSFWSEFIKLSKQVVVVMWVRSVCSGEGAWWSRGVFRISSLSAALQFVLGVRSERKHGWESAGVSARRCFTLQLSARSVASLSWVITGSGTLGGNWASSASVRSFTGGKHSKDVSSLSSVRLSLPVRPPTVNLGAGRLQGNYLTSDRSKALGMRCCCYYYYY